MLKKYSKLYILDEPDVYDVLAVIERLQEFDKRRLSIFVE